MNVRTALLASLSLVIPAAAQADVLWSSGFETGNLSEWSGKLNPDKNGTRQNIVVVGAPVVAGQHAAELTIHPDDLWPNNHNRVELHQDGKRTQEGQTTFLSWYFMLHDEAKTHDDIGYWETANSYQQSMAFFVEPSGTGTTLAFRTNKPSGKQHFKVPLSAKAWHQIAVQILWSADANAGRVNVWLDGNKLVDNVAAQTKPNGDNLFLQVGFHRDASAPPIETLSIDEAIEGTSLDEVLMKPTVTPVTDAGTNPGGTMKGDAGAGDPSAVDAGSAPGSSHAPDAMVSRGSDASVHAPGEPRPTSDGGSSGTRGDASNAPDGKVEPQVPAVKITGSCQIARSRTGSSVEALGLVSLGAMLATRRRRDRKHES